MVYLYEFVKALQGCQAHRGRHLTHFAVRTDVHNHVQPCKAKIAHSAQPCSKFIIIRGYRTPLKTIEKLCGMEAEHFCVAKAAYHLALMCIGKGMGGIEQQLEVVFMSNVAECFNITGAPPNMYTQDAGRARGN